MTEGVKSLYARSGTNTYTLLRKQLHIYHRSHNVVVIIQTISITLLGMIISHTKSNLQRVLLHVSLFCIFFIIVSIKRKRINVYVKKFPLLRYALAFLSLISLTRLSHIHPPKSDLDSTGI